jgi:hypothetical protein
VVRTVREWRDLSMRKLPLKLMLSATAGRVPTLRGTVEDFPWAQPWVRVTTAGPAIRGSPWSPWSSTARMESTRKPGRAVAVEFLRTLKSGSTKVPKSPIQSPAQTMSAVRAKKLHALKGAHGPDRPAISIQWKLGLMGTDHERPGMSQIGPFTEASPGSDQ